MIFHSTVVRLGRIFAIIVIVTFFTGRTNDVSLMLINHVLSYGLQRRKIPKRVNSSVSDGRLPKDNTALVEMVFSCGNLNCWLTRRLIDIK